MPRMRYRFLLLLLLGACTQNLAGIIKVEYGVDRRGQPTVSYESGKELATVTATYLRSPDGSVSITVEAGDVRAFEGQRIRAEVDKAVIGAVSKILPQALEVALCAAGIVTAC